MDGCETPTNRVGGPTEAVWRVLEGSFDVREEIDYSSREVSVVWYVGVSSAVETLAIIARCRALHAHGKQLSWRPDARRDKRFEIGHQFAVDVTSAGPMVGEVPLSCLRSSTR